MPLHTLASATTCLVLSGLLVLGSGCKKAPQDNAAAADKAAATKTAPAPAEPAKPATKAPPVAPPAAPVEYAGAHILIAYKGAMRADPKVTRTKEQAKKLATELVAQAKKNPDQFAELAKKNSDGPSGARGGSLGSWRKGRMVPAFDEAIGKLEVGQISPEPVETPFGFHVMKRDALPPTFAGAHILIAYKGAMRAAPKVTRSQKEAQKLAAKLAAEAKAKPDSFAELAKKNSDGPSGPRGGSLGSWRKGRMVPAFDIAIEKLKVGQVSDPVQTPFGYHVIKREAPPAP